ncbi:MAG: tRNA threonylcarbamoyladenosine dehydratase [Lentisphaeria bacterium]|jgi:tRNA A37 threonylcarbamoyladenosine dehydratase
MPIPIPSLAQRFQRARLLLGADALAALHAARVTIVGLGGVGAYAAEALARAPVGHLRLIDPDTVQPSNLNRQLPALASTLGRPKAEVVAERLREINPDAEIVALTRRFHAAAAAELLAGPPDLVVDAIDSVADKIALIAWCVHHHIPLVASMGAACKLDPARVRAGDLAHTSGCPLARVVRRELRAQGIHRGVRVVFSDEPARPNLELPESPAEAEATATTAAAGSRQPIINGTISFMPGLFGLHCAAEAIHLLLARHAAAGAAAAPSHA